MKKVIAFTGSNSSTSINKELLMFATKQVTEAKVEFVDLTKYPLPIYSEDIEKGSGFPQELLDLAETLNGADGYIVSSPEHNGLMTAFLKNTLDWLSRSTGKYLGEETPVLLLSTSPGKGGGAGNLGGLERLVTYAGGRVKGHFSLPSFYENFKTGQIINSQEREKLIAAVKEFEAALETVEA